MFQGGTMNRMHVPAIIMLFLAGPWACDEKAQLPAFSRSSFGPIPRAAREEPSLETLQNQFPGLTVSEHANTEFTCPAWILREDREDVAWLWQFNKRIVAVTIVSSRVKAQDGLQVGTRFGTLKRQKDLRCWLEKSPYVKQVEVARPVVACATSKRGTRYELDASGVENLIHPVHERSSDVVIDFSRLPDDRSVQRVHLDFSSEADRQEYERMRARRAFDDLEAPQSREASAIYCRFLSGQEGWHLGTGIDRPWKEVKDEIAGNNERVRDYVRSGHSHAYDNELGSE
jgi:hypothetical protein